MSEPLSMTDPRQRWAEARLELAVSLHPAGHPDGEARVWRVDDRNGHARAYLKQHRVPDKWHRERTILVRLREPPAAAVPELLDEGLSVVRDKVAGLDDGLPLSARLDAVLRALYALTRPDRVAHATRLVDSLLPTLDRFAALPLATVEASLGLLGKLGEPANQAALAALLDRLPALSASLLALPTDAGTLALLNTATTIVGVGELAFVEDPSGNVVGLMRYDEGAR